MEQDQQMGKMRTGTILLFALLAVAGLGAVGCGGGGSDEPEELPRKTYLSKADAICEKTEGRQEARFKKLQEENPKKTFDAIPDQEEVVVVAGVPPLRTQVEELRELGVPEGEAEQAEKVVNSIEKAIDEAEQEPEKVLDPATTPFTKSEQAARKFGLKACGSA